MTDRSKEVFGNVQPEKVQKKAEKSKAKYARKFGDDSAADYPVRIVPNACLHPFFGVSDIRLAANCTSDIVPTTVRYGNSTSLQL